MREPTRWTREQLAGDLAVSVDTFRAERIAEPKTFYEGRLTHREPQVREVVRWLRSFVQGTDDPAQTSAILTDPDKFKALCYVPSPFISRDDMKTLAISTLSQRDLRGSQELWGAIRQTISQAADDHRFPWLDRGDDPTEEEFNAAIMATLALMATQDATTHRRKTAKDAQEEAVRAVLAGAGFEFDPSRNRINADADGPQAGHYSGERSVGGSLADVVVTSLDGTLVPIECKVSNSAVNSHKRLVHEAGHKAAVWQGAIPECVPAVVVAGVFNLDNLVRAQDDGLAIFWQHRLADLTDCLTEE